MEQEPDLAHPLAAGPAEADGGRARALPTRWPLVSGEGPAHAGTTQMGTTLASALEDGQGRAPHPRGPWRHHDDDLDMLGTLG